MDVTSTMSRMPKTTVTSSLAAIAMRLAAREESTCSAIVRRRHLVVFGPGGRIPPMPQGSDLLHDLVGFVRCRLRGCLPGS